MTRCSAARSATHEAIAPRNLINLKSVGKGYGSHAVLDDVTLGLNEGERVGVVGENGAGKSTLVRLIAGARSPTKAPSPAPRGRGGARLPARRARPRGHGPRRARRDAGRARMGTRRRVSRRARRAARRRRVDRLRRRHADADRDPVGRRAAAVMLARALLGSPGAAAARRADQPPRRRGDRWLAGSWPSAGARCWSSPTTAGFSTPSASAPGRSPTAGSTSTTAATRPTCSPGPSATARPRPARTAAVSSCARSSRGCAAGRRPGPPSRSSGSTPPTR